jgi:hypothetical protein
MKTWNENLILTPAIWASRGLVLLVFLLWGAFFVEHLREWFIAPLPKTPPPKVWFGQALHFLLLVGLLIALRWPLAGSALVMVAALVFFPRAGSNYLLFTGITVMPPLGLLCCWLWRRNLAGRKAPNQI